MLDSVVTMTVEGFFSLAASSNREVERFLVSLFERQKSLEVSIIDDAVNLTLCDFEPALVFHGNLSGDFNQIATSKVNSILTPMLVDFDKVRVPHSSFMKVQLDSSIGNLVSEAMYNHMLRALEFKVEEGIALSSILKEHYFSFLRGVFPESFDRREGEFQFSIASLASSHCFWKDPFLVCQARLLKLQRPHDQSSLHDLVRERLDAIRERIFEVV